MQLKKLLYKSKVESAPEYKTKRFERKRFERKEKRVTDLVGVLKRQVAEEIGDAEVTKDQRFVLLQKYGTVVPKIDRKVTRPSWMSTKEFNQKVNEWFRATKNLVPAQQEKKFGRASNPSLKRKFRTERSPRRDQSQKHS
ncbi:MAG: hypothetical protein C5B59_06720 [Bacteroidetes bacterium]|nr:MAG: hypothetical protein C5B59_06720 [Bacteroidota bacterium]